MLLSSRLLAGPMKMLRNRDSVLYKKAGQALSDFAKVSGASVLAHLGLAVLIVEFGFPTPDIIYDLKLKFSSDFALYAKYGELAERRLDFENRLRAIQREEEKVLYKRTYQKSPESRFGGIL